jgi:hypothetical protein
MPSVSKKLLESKIKEVEATAGLDETGKAKFIELYQKSLTNLKKASSY